MLLQKLSDYFNRVEDAAPPMYIKTPIRWLIDLDRSGKLLGFVRTAGGGTGKKDRGKEFSVPHVGRSSGVRAKLLADNGEYVLGIARPKSKRERVRECHAAFVEQITKCAEATHEPAVQAVLKFLRNWNPTSGRPSDDFDPGDVMTFRVDGELPSDFSSVRTYWASLASPGGSDRAEAEDAGEAMQCLICGERKPAVKRLPFKIKRIPGGQTAGTTMISANVPAFESYGLEASLIAPTCHECGERFSKAANALIEGEHTHITVGPIVYIFWTKEECGFNPATLLSRPEPDEVRALIASAFTGNAVATGLKEEPFYAAAFSASAARVAVRDWLDTTVTNARQNLARYFTLQQIVDRDGSAGRPLGLFALAASTVRDANRELPPHVPQSLLHVALKGGPLPMGLLFQAVKRNRAEQTITRPRAALIKIVLLSKNLDWKKEDAMVQLDPNNQNPAYLCGRLMGVLEAVQRAALPGINTTITDRFFGTASSAPASVFSRLLRGAQPHLAKLRRERRGTYEALQRRLEEILAGLPTFPKTLTLENQGLFSLGYYHQRASDRAAAAAYREARKTGEEQADAKNRS